MPYELETMCTSTLSYIKSVSHILKTLIFQGDIIYLRKQDVQKNSCDDCVSAALPKMALSRPIKRRRRAKRC